MTERESAEVAWLYITRTPNVDALAKQEAMDAYRSLTTRLSRLEEALERIAEFGNDLRQPSPQRIARTALDSETKER